MRSPPFPDFVRASDVSIWWIEGGIALTRSGDHHGEPGRVVVLDEELQPRFSVDLSAPYDLVADRDRLWVSDPGVGDIVEIDRSTGEISHRFVRLSEAGPRYLTGRLCVTDGRLICAGTETEPNSRGVTDRTAAAFDLATGDLAWEFRADYDAAWPTFVAAKPVPSGMVALLDSFGRQFTLSSAEGHRRGFHLLDGFGRDLHWGGAQLRIDDVHGKGWPQWVLAGEQWYAFNAQGREVERLPASAVLAVDGRGRLLSEAGWWWEADGADEAIFVPKSRLPEGPKALGPGGHRLVVLCPDGSLREFRASDF